MESRIITVKDELEAMGEELILSKDSIKFLTDKENPYLSARDKEGKMSVFALWEKIHYGILTSNIMCLLEEKLGSFIGSVFKSVKGITDDLFTEEYFFQLIGREKEKGFRQAMKKLRASTQEENGEEGHAPRRVSFGEAERVLRWSRGLGEETPAPPQQPIHVDYTTTTANTSASSLPPSYHYGMGREEMAIPEDREQTADERIREEIEHLAQETVRRLNRANDLTDEEQTLIYTEAIRQEARARGVL